MGRHYNRAKKPGGMGWRKGHANQKEGRAPEGEVITKLAADYGVAEPTIYRAGKLATAVETLKAVDPDIAYRAGPDGWRPRLRDLADPPKPDLISSFSSFSYL